MFRDFFFYQDEEARVGSGELSGWESWGCKDAHAVYRFGTPLMQGGDCTEPMVSVYCCVLNMLTNPNVFATSYTAVFGLRCRRWTRAGIDPLWAILKLMNAELEIQTCNMRIAFLESKISACYPMFLERWIFVLPVPNWDAIFRITASNFPCKICMSTVKIFPDRPFLEHLSATNTNSLSGWWCAIQ